jgi:hypothetical protein
MSKVNENSKDIRFLIIRRIQYDIYDYFNLINSLFCNRCLTTHNQEIQRRAFNKTYKEEIFSNIKKEIYNDKIMLKNNSNGKDIKIDWGSDALGRVHHIFILKKYFYSDNINKKMIENWFSDIKHGYFHGLMVGFIAYFFIKYIYDYDFGTIKFSEKVKERKLYYKKFNDLGKIFFSCFLHDFVKCTDGDKDHDIKLKSFFPNLLEETYRHSKPNDNEWDNILITADRIELRRYDDYNEWKIDKIHDYYSKKLDKHQNLYLKIFYKSVRPCLEYFYENREFTFLRHGLESKFNNNDFYPYDYYGHFAEKINNNETFDDNYAIELDIFPFRYCSNHSGNAIWTFFKGFLKIDDKLVNNSSIGYWIDKPNEKKYTTHHDHLCIYTKDKKKINEWRFLLRPEIFLLKRKLVKMLDKFKTQLTNKDIQLNLDILLNFNTNFVTEDILLLLDNNLFNFKKYFNIFDLCNSK